MLSNEEILRMVLTLIQILTRTKHSSLSSNNNSFHSIVNTSHAEEMLNLISHHVCECIVLLWSVESAYQDWSWLL